MSVLVVVPTVGPVETKARLFKQLQKDTYVAEVIVVDNGECFNLKNHSHLKKFTEVDAGCNLHWLASCNLGAAIAASKNFQFVCFLNDDLILSNHFFRGLVHTAMSNDNVGAVVPLYTGKSCLPAYDDKSQEEWKAQQEDKRINGIDGTCLLIPTTVLKEVGYLDPVFYGPGWGSELDYRLRLEKAGYHVYLSKRCKAWHDNPATSYSKHYGSREQYVKTGCKLARQGFGKKYGPNWREELNLKKAFTE